MTYIFAKRAQWMSEPPIPNLENIDVLGRRRDGGVDPSIMVRKMELLVFRAPFTRWIAPRHHPRERQRRLWPRPDPRPGTRPGWRLLLPLPGADSTR